MFQALVAGEVLPVVDHSANALKAVQEIIGKVDFSVFMTMFVSVIGATIAVTVGITALKKGIKWLTQAVKKAGN